MAAERASPKFCEATTADCWKIGLIKVMMRMAAMITTISIYKGDQSLPRFTQAPTESRPAK